MRDQKPSSFHRSRSFKPRRELDPEIVSWIEQAEKILLNGNKPAVIDIEKDEQQKSIRAHFYNSEEYKVKSYQESEKIRLVVFPIGKLKRLAEEKIQEVLMTGRKLDLDPMGPYERFVIHDYLKGRDGVRTESIGEEGKDRHIEIYPIYGRSLKRFKKRLI